MSASDLEIARTAKQWLERRGHQAIAEARLMCAECRRQGDHEGADLCLRIIVAIEELQRAPPDAAGQ